MTKTEMRRDGDHVLAGLNVLAAPVNVVIALLEVRVPLGEVVGVPELDPEAPTAPAVVPLDAEEPVAADDGPVLEDEILGEEALALLVERGAEVATEEALLLAMGVDAGGVLEAAVVVVGVVEAGAGVVEERTSGAALARVLAGVVLLGLLAATTLQ